MKAIEMYKKGFISEERYETLIKDNLKIISNKFDKWIDKAFDYANMHSDDDDIIYKSIFRYKALRNLPEEYIDAIYSEIANRLGHGGNNENSYY